jgi:hypothetical protein
MPKHSRRPSGAYLNVDLEVRAQFDLAALVKGLSRTTFNLHSGRVDGAHFASFEAPTCGSSPDEAIAAMVMAVSGLPRAARALWDRAADRVFDIGIEHASGTWPFALGLSQDTLKAVVDVGARVAFTLYPLSKGRLPNKPLPRT